MEAPFDEHKFSVARTSGNSSVHCEEMVSTRQQVTVAG